MEFEQFSRFLLVFTSLFVIVEPLGSIPAFVGLTQKFSDKDVERVSRKACIFSFVFLVFFLCSELGSSSSFNFKWTPSGRQEAFCFY